MVTIVRKSIETMARLVTMVITFMSAVAMVARVTSRACQFFGK